MRAPVLHNQETSYWIRSSAQGPPQWLRHASPVNGQCEVSSATAHFALDRLSGDVVSGAIKAAGVDLPALSNYGDNAGRPKERVALAAVRCHRVARTEAAVPDVIKSGRTDDAKRRAFVALADCTTVAISMNAGDTSSSVDLADRAA